MYRIYNLNFFQYELIIFHPGLFSILKKKKKNEKR